MTRRLVPSSCLVWLLVLWPAVAPGQVFGKAARTEFISGFGVRTFASIQERLRLRSDGLGEETPEVQVRTTPISIVYGLRSRLSLVAVVPFVQTTRSHDDGEPGIPQRAAAGIGDSVFLAKWRFFRRDQPIGTLRLSTEFGVKAPTGADDLTDPEGRRLPSAMQRGSGSWDPVADVIVTYVPAGARGRWTLTGDIGMTMRTEAHRVEIGNDVGYDGMVKYRVHPARYPGRDTFLLLELNGRWRGRTRIGGLAASDSGGHVIYLSPGIQTLLRQNLILEGGVQLPVMRDLHGMQLVPGMRVLVGLRYIIMP